MVRTLARRASLLTLLAQESDITRRQACCDLQRIEGEGHRLTHTHASWRKSLAIRYPGQPDGDGDPRIGGPASSAAACHCSGSMDRREALGRTRRS